MKQLLKHNWVIIIIFLLAIILRLKFAAIYSNADLFIQLNWGQQANSLGTLKGYYEWDVWAGSYPDHPPLISWLYSAIFPLHSKIMWFLSSLGNFIAIHRLAPTKFLWLYDFSTWFGTVKYGTLAILFGFIFLLKQFMIIADISIAITIYYLCRKAKINWQKYVLTYLFIPFSWYLSSSWGQSDQLSFIFLIISFILITSKKFSTISPLLYAISINFKPNGILLLPVYLYTWYRQGRKISSLIIGGIFASVFTFWVFSWFTDRNVFQFLLTILPKRLNTSGGLINYNAFNFWYIFYPFDSNSIISRVPDNKIFLIFTAKVWGFILSAATSLLSFKVFVNKKIENIFAAMFVAGFGSWLFMTGIHERYSFLAVCPLLILSVYQKRYFKYFLILSTIYTLNMFIAYWPWENLNWFSDVLKSNSFLLPRLLSVLNIAVYVWITNLLIKNSRKNKVAPHGFEPQ